MNAYGADIMWKLHLVLLELGENLGVEVRISVVRRGKGVLEWGAKMGPQTNLVCASAKEFRKVAQGLLPQAGGLQRGRAGSFLFLS